jgi:hypothetical protein
MDEQNCIYLEINIEPQNGSVFVHSDEVPGLNLMGPSFEALKPTVEKAIIRLYKDNEQMAVKLLWLKSQDEPKTQILARVAVCPLRDVA